MELDINIWKLGSNKIKFQLQLNKFINKQKLLLFGKVYSRINIH